MGNNRGGRSSRQPPALLRLIGILSVFLLILSTSVVSKEKHSAASDTGEGIPEQIKQSTLEQGDGQGQSQQLEGQGQKEEPQQEKQKPVRVVTVLRHGARTPSSLEIPTGWSLHTSNHLGVLTVPGRLSSYLLGVQASIRYRSLLLYGAANNPNKTSGSHRTRDDGQISDNPDPEKETPLSPQQELRLIRRIGRQPLKRWMMRASSRNRAIESAEYFLRGFFGYKHGIKQKNIELFMKQIKNSGQDSIFDAEAIKGLNSEILKKKQKKPFLILTPDRSQDPLLKSHHVEVCKYGKSKAEDHAAKIIEDFLKKDHHRSYKRASIALTRAWNITGHITPRIMKKVSDICTSHGYHHPDEGFCGKYPELASYLEKISCVVHSSYYTDNTFLKVSLHNFVRYLSMHLSPSSRSPDFIFISTHESTLTPLLRLLKYPGWDKSLPYSASITFEVYRSHIKVFYNREELQICPPLPSTKNQGCSHLQFAEVLRRGMFQSDDAFQQHCEVPLPTKDLRRLVDKLTGKWQLPLVILCVVVTTLAFKVVQAKKTAVLVQKPKAT